MLIGDYIKAHTGQMIHVFIIKIDVVLLAVSWRQFESGKIILLIFLILHHNLDSLTFCS